MGGSAIDRGHEQHHVVIIGGGFGGLYAAKKLANASVKVTLVDRNNHHLFQPLLYQVAAGGLSPGEIASPLRAVLSRYRNIEIVLGEAIDIDPQQQKVVLRDGVLPFDSLVLAPGSSHNYFGNDHWETAAPGLKTIENALDIRRRVFLAFEAAERETNPNRRRAWMTFVIVGAGPTGVELAGTLGELAHRTLKNDFRQIDPAEAEILLVEADERILMAYPVKLSEKAGAALRRLGVQLHANTMVTDIRNSAVTLEGSDREETVRARTILWTAGVKASPLGQILHDRIMIELDQRGKVLVEPDLSVRGFRNIFVIGDLASFRHQTDKPLPALAAVAKQQGQYVAKIIRKRLYGQQTKPFRYRDRGTLAVIGRNAAVADFKWIRFSGFPAWLIWVFVHIAMLVEFDNKVMVMFQYAWNYFTRKRGARLITGGNLFPLVSRDESSQDQDARSGQAPSRLSQLQKRM